MQKTIKLSNDAVYPVIWCGAADGVLWIQFVGVVNVEDVVGNTDSVLFDYGSELTAEHVGYTEYIDSIVNSDGSLMGFRKTME